MSIDATELEFYESSAKGLGGAITSTVIPSNTLLNVFDKIIGGEASQGMVDYRCIYIKNNNASLTLSSAIVKLTEQVALSSIHIGIGKGTSPIGGIEQIIPSESNVPNGVRFSEEVNEDVAIGDVAAGKHFAVWLRRRCNVGTPAFTSEGFSVTVAGESP